MKSWFYSLILLSLCTAFIKAILPKGEKSPLHSSLRFLIATMLIAVSFSPLLPLFGKDLTFSLTNPFEESEAIKTTESEILRRFGERLNESVSKKFGEVNFTLSVFADENKIPKTIEISCENKTAADEIAAFIETNFQIEAIVK